MAKESKYASTLRERGFRQATDAEEAYIQRRLSLRLEQLKVPEARQAVSRKKRRAFDKMIARPYFTVLPGLRTYAKDELGRSWFADTFVNLTDLGFEDSTKDLATALALPLLRTADSAN